MKPTLSHVLVSLGCILLAVDIGLRLGAGDQSPVAHGQTSTSGDLIMAASQTQNEAFCFVFDRSTNHLVSYRNRSTTGLELMGIRNCSYDLAPKINEYPQSQSATAVSRMLEMTERLTEKEKKKE